MKLTIKLAIFTMFLTLTANIISAQSQLEMNQEACGAYQKADAELNKVYKQLLAKNKSDKALSDALRNEQRVWITFRDAQLNSRFPLAKGENPREKFGSVYPMCRCLVLENLTNERTAVLREMLNAETIEGDVCGTIAAKQIGQMQLVRFNNLDATVSAVETLENSIQSQVLNSSAVVINLKKIYIEYT